MERENIQLDVKDTIAEIILDRPEALNAFTPTMLDDLNTALETVMENEETKAILITGRERGFCSGADVKGMEGREDREQKHTYRAHLGKVQNVIRLLYSGPKPTIAAINGPAVGAGADFALACDLRVMSETAFLRQQFVNIGIAPADGGGWLLPRLIGESKAKFYFLLGKDISPQDAKRDGLVIEITEPGETLAKAREIAEEVASKPMIGMKNTKQLIDITQSFEEYTERAVELQWECINDPEHYEAVNELIDE